MADFDRLLPNPFSFGQNPIIGLLGKMAVKDGLRYVENGIWKAVDSGVEESVARAAVSDVVQELKSFSDSNAESSTDVFDRIKDAMKRSDSVLLQLSGSSQPTPAAGAHRRNRTRGNRLGTIPYFPRQTMVFERIPTANFPNQEAVDSEFTQVADDVYIRNGAFSFGIPIISPLGFAHENSGPAVPAATNADELCFAYDMKPTENDKECKEVCTICLEELAEITGDNKQLKFPCEHRLHTACAREWLKTSASCPMCRTKLEIE